MTMTRHKQQNPAGISLAIKAKRRGSTRRWPHDDTEGVALAVTRELEARGHGYCDGDCGGGGDFEFLFLFYVATKREAVRLVESVMTELAPDWTYSVEKCKPISMFS
jgi:hypothetical protein